MDEIVLIGDSITQFGSSLDYTGWVLLLTQKQLRKRQVLNHGYSGYNTAWIKQILPQILHSSQRPKLYTLFLGANDACLYGTQKIELKDYKQNLIDIITMLGSVPVILITPPKVCRPLDDIRTSENTNRYRQECMVVGSIFKNCTVVDTWDFIDESCLCDGLHFNELGNLRLFERVETVIDHILGVGSYFFSDWKDISK
jgi:lysophospholipase L1-like esterase